jgi:hypothetical protein
VTKEVREHGTFGYIDTSLATPDMNAFPPGVGPAARTMERR